MNYIDLAGQYQKIKPTLEKRFEQVFKHCRFILGPEVQELEQRLADYVGVKHCIAVSNGTTALLMAMLALDIQRGDDVITSPFSFIAPMEMITLLGAKPVLIDIDPNTYNLNVDQLEAAITPRTKLILPVDIFGQCPDYDRIKTIAQKHGLHVVEDAAQSFGATYKTRKAGGLADIGCTSFFPSKPFGCYGDGGACFTNDDRLASKLRQLANHGQEGRYYHTSLGFNARLDTLQAAVLLTKLDFFEQEIAERQQVAQRYDQLLRDYVKVPFIDPNNTSVYAQYTIEVDNRTQLIDSLHKMDIPTAIHYPMPLNAQPVFAELNFPKLPVVERACQRVLSLPFYPDLALVDQQAICASIKKALILEKVA